MRKIGIDYGDSRIGIAISDPTGLIASPYETYFRRNLDLDIKYLTDLALEKQADSFIVGLPINMDGSLGARVEKTKEFSNLLEEKSGIKIVFWDERLSTVQAQKRIDEMNVKKNKQKDLIDKLAAQIILQSYLDSNYF